MKHSRLRISLNVGSRLKCNRVQPCDSCTRRGLSLSCTYLQNKATQKLDRNALLRDVRPANIQDRLGQLEKLVMDTLSAKTPSSQRSSANSDDVSQLAGSFGRIGIENAEISYVEGAHWTAILDGVLVLTLQNQLPLTRDQIGELKDYFEDGPTGPGNEPIAPSPDGPELLFGGFKDVRKQDLLADLPPRLVVDRLIAKCFNAMDTATSMSIYPLPVLGQA